MRTLLLQIQLWIAYHTHFLLWPIHLQVLLFKSIFCGFPNYELKSGHYSYEALCIHSLTDWVSLLNLPLKHCSEYWSVSSNLGGSSILNKDPYILLQFFFLLSLFWNCRFCSSNLISFVSQEHPVLLIFWHQAKNWFFHQFNHGDINVSVSYSMLFFFFYINFSKSLASLNFLLQFLQHWN